MTEITTTANPNFPIPTWDFQGISTGIANKRAGLGQIGAGTVTPPMECFEKAVLAYAKKLGFKGE